MSVPATNAVPRRPLTIAVLVQTRAWGGLEMHTLDLVRSLAAGGARAFVVCLGQPAWDRFRAAADPEVELRLLPPPAKRTARGWFRVLAAIDADAVVLQKNTLHAVELGLDLALRARFRRFVTVEHLEPPRIPSPAPRRYLGGLIPGPGLWRLTWRGRGYGRSLGPRKIVCVSDSVREALQRDYGFPRRKLMTIRNGIDLNRFGWSGERRTQARTAWGIPEDAFVFGSVRRFVPEKGLDVAVRAFGQLRAEQRHQNAYLVLVGEGPEAPVLRALAEQLGVSDRVITPGFTTTPWNAYPGFDVFLLPSRIEALGIVAAEAMASGCFVIGSDVGGIPEVLSSEDVGRLVPADCAQALARTMGEAMALSPANRRQVTERARRHVTEHFNSAVQFGRIGDVLRADR